MIHLTLAGIGNSGPEHWQTRWHTAAAGGVWVEHDDWENVDRAVWVDDMHRTMRGLEGPVLLVAHSLGCLLAAEYLTAFGASGVVGAFLVAVPDTTAAAFPETAIGFRHGTALSMPVPAVVLSSTNDPYGSLEHATAVAEHWGARLVDLGTCGHINADSDLGVWSQGRTHLDAFVAGL